MSIEKAMSLLTLRALRIDLQLFQQFGCSRPSAVFRATIVFQDMAAPAQPTAHPIEDAASRRSALQDARAAVGPSVDRRSHG